MVKTDIQPTKTNVNLQTALEGAKLNFEVAQRRVEAGEAPVIVFANARSEVAKLEFEFDKLPYDPTTSVFFIENGKSYFFDNIPFNSSILIEAPPSKITLKAAKSGNYEIFVWAD